MLNRKWPLPENQNSSNTMSMDHTPMEVSESVNKTFKSNIIPGAPEDPGAYVDEFRSSIDAGSNPPSVTIVLEADRPCVIYYVLYSFSPLGAATLQIGDRIIPIPSTTVKPPDTFDVAMIVYPKDVIKLSAAGATSMFLEIMGKVLSGTDWVVV